MPDLLLFPHCDLHMALTGTPPLKLRLVGRGDLDATTKRYPLTQIFPAPPGQTAPVKFEFLEPHAPPGQRINAHLPTVAADGTVQATVAGVYLFQARTVPAAATEPEVYIVGRLQVHKKPVAWWFGNDSITTALDTDPVKGLAHAQPSIYMEFEDDAAPGTDRIGDITGHGYVQLTPVEPDKLVVTADGRLRGLVETPTPPAGQPAGSTPLAGTMAGLPPRNPLPVRVVSYAKQRFTLEGVGGVRGGSVAGIDELHNILFVAEGFRETDRRLFNDLVTSSVHDMFDKERHQPYPTLRSGFNVFKAFLPSQQYGLTCGFRIGDNGPTAGKGIPVPSDFTADKHYSTSELVARVGFPKRGETGSRSALVDTWTKQGLRFEPARIDNTLIDRWKAQQSFGIMNASDTVLGLQLGGRPADRDSNSSITRVSSGGDVSGTHSPFILRLYEFYQQPDNRLMSLDPRRHPPELYATDSLPNPGNSVLQYINGLVYPKPGTPLPLGGMWQPDDLAFKRSRGLVVIVGHEELDGGTSINAQTLTAQTLHLYKNPFFTYDASRREMRRNLGTINIDENEFVDTIAHELGHSFNLDDEYEDIRGRGDADKIIDMPGDNVARFGYLQVPGTSTGQIQAELIKWFRLHRMAVSSRLTQNAVEENGRLRVTVPLQDMAKWKQMESRKSEVFVDVRNVEIKVRGRQLPFTEDADHHLLNLRIDRVDEALGLIVLTGVPPSPSGLRTIVKGAVVFVAQGSATGEALYVVEKAVQTHLLTKKLPLNSVKENVEISGEEDNPVPIAGFTPPHFDQTTVGLYEGGAHYAGGHYRPAGGCKMRSHRGPSVNGKFCFVCKWLIVNRVDPGYHALVNRLFYPKSS
ncbi:hypothetical protein D5S17_05490 [Pseudonocardiaceae bacterium YIM PH 21723]|nr:hypothetical protein D5S17_05490 [Pseudonocardiaceae bacterium YIM PH 21723]